MSNQLTNSERAEFKIRFARVKKNGIELATDLLWIKSKDRWKAEFNSWKDFCAAVNLSYHRAFQLISFAEVQETLTDVNIPNEATAREIKKIALPQRRQIVSEASKQSGGKLSVPAIKKANQTALQKKDTIKDATGLEVPPEIQEFWARNEEAQHLLSMISKVKTTLEKAKIEGDLLFKFVDIQGCVAKCQMVYEEIQGAKSYAVCPKCNGVLFSDCTDCRKRGTLPKFYWDRVPEEIRKLRE